MSLWITSLQCETDESEVDLLCWCNAKAQTTKCDVSAGPIVFSCYYWWFDVDRLNMCCYLCVSVVGGLNDFNRAGWCEITNQNSLSASSLRRIFSATQPFSSNPSLFFLVWLLLSLGRFLFVFAGFCVHFVCTWLHNNAQAIHWKLNILPGTHTGRLKSCRPLFEKGYVLMPAREHPFILAHRPRWTMTRIIFLLLLLLLLLCVRWL